MSDPAWKKMPAEPPRGPAKFGAPSRRIAPIVASHCAFSVTEKHDDVESTNTATAVESSAATSSPKRAAFSFGSQKKEGASTGGCGGGFSFKKLPSSKANTKTFEAATPSHHADPESTTPSTEQEVCLDPSTDDETKREAMSAEIRRFGNQEKRHFATEKSHADSLEERRNMRKFGMMHHPVGHGREKQKERDSDNNDIADHPSTASKKAFVSQSPKFTSSAVLKFLEREIIPFEKCGDTVAFQAASKGRMDVLSHLQGDSKVYGVDLSIQDPTGGSSTILSRAVQSKASQNDELGEVFRFFVDVVLVPESGYSWGCPKGGVVESGLRRKLAYTASAPIVTEDDCIAAWHQVTRRGSYYHLASPLLLLIETIDNEEVTTQGSSCSTATARLRYLLQRFGFRKLFLHKESPLFTAAATTPYLDVLLEFAEKEGALPELWSLRNHKGSNIFGCFARRYHELCLVFLRSNLKKLIAAAKYDEDVIFQPRLDGSGTILHTLMDANYASAHFLLEAFPASQQQRYSSTVSSGTARHAGLPSTTSPSSWRNGNECPSPYILTLRTFHSPSWWRGVGCLLLELQRTPSDVPSPPLLFLTPEQLLMHEGSAGGGDATTLALMGGFSWASTGTDKSAGTLFQPIALTSHAVMATMLI